MKTSTVRNIPENLSFVSDSQDAQSIKDYIGQSASDYDAFFVGQCEGDYTEVWGIVGIVPYLSKLATKLI